MTPVSSWSFQRMEQGSLTTAIKTAATSRQVPEPTRELTTDELNQIAGGTTPSIPILPPGPHVYAIGRIESSFSTLT